MPVIEMQIIENTVAAPTVEGLKNNTRRKANDAGIDQYPNGVCHWYGLPLV
ncbi:MAG: hypothetical protein ACRESZ_21505 [Methylococcales bacterium]